MVNMLYNDAAVMSWVWPTEMHHWSESIHIHLQVTKGHPHNVPHHLATNLLVVVRRYLSRQRRQDGWP